MSLKIRAGLVLSVVGALSSAAAAATDAPAQVPIEIFVKQQAIWHATISPDGQFLTYSVLADAHYIDFAAAIGFRNLATGKVNGVATGDYQTAIDPRWVANDRIIYGDIPFTMSGIDRDGKNYTGLLGVARVFDQDDRQVKSGKGRLHFSTGNIFLNPPYTDGTIIFSKFAGSQSGHILMLEYDHPLMFEHAGQAWANCPNVINLDTRTADFTRILQNPGKVVGWLTDKDGVVRVGVERDEGYGKVIYRPSEGAPWRSLPGLEHVKPTVGLLGLSGDGVTLYISTLTPAGTWGVYVYNLQKQQLGDLLVGHEHYDILRTNLTADGHAIERIVFAPVTHEMLGIQFVTDKPQVVWFDATLAAVQAALDHALPNRVNTITGLSDDRKKILVLTWTAKDPGGYLLFDLEKKALNPLFATRPWFKPEQMGEVYPISYTSRDGLVIHGYLTVPAGKEPKNLPLVVYPHDGPFARDSWSFDQETQFLASRGYAILQMNYRGTPGYGEDFHAKGIGHIGKEIQDDITDGTRWAIAQGIADPHRIAIFGNGYISGYCAVMGVTREPDLYRCGLDLAGITDWRSVAKRDRANQANDEGILASKGTVTDEQLMHHSPGIIDRVSADRLFGQKEFVDLLGEAGKDDASLAEISPVNQADRIRAPLLLVYNKDDLSFSYKQAQLLREAMDKAHKPYESVKYKGEPKTLLVADRADLYRKIEQFLAANMAP